MAATRIYSTAAYYVAGVVAILFGLCPKFGALVAATPGGVLGGITVVLYGMIGLLGAKIWIENRVDFANPINLVPIGAGIILAVGPVAHQISDDFTPRGHRAGHDRRCSSATTCCGGWPLRTCATAGHPGRLRRRHRPGARRRRPARASLGEIGFDAVPRRRARTDPHPGDPDDPDAPKRRS